MGLLGDLGVSKYMPDMSGVLSLGGNIGYIALFILFLIIMGVVIFYFYRMRVYKFNIRVFENLGGVRYVETGQDKARLIRVGEGGEMILWLKKYKCYRTAYGKKMGKNTFWFAIGQDGYWYNCTLGDLDAKQGMLDIEPIDRDMRYMHVAIRKNIQDRYRKDKFMDKYGGWLLAGIFMIIMLFGIWFLMSKMSDAAVQLSNTAVTNREVAQLLREVLGATDNLCSSSGIA